MELSSEIFEDVRLARRYDEAELVDAAEDHALEQIFAHGARALDSIGHAAADRQQLFRKSQRLYARSTASGGNNAPHFRPRSCPRAWAPGRSPAPRSIRARAAPMYARPVCARALQP